MQRLQLEARLETERLDEALAGGAEHGERVRLAARTVQREHQLGDLPLAQRVRTHERLEFLDKRSAASELEVGIDPLLERAHAQLLEAFGLDQGERLVDQVGQRQTAPEPKRLLERARRRRQVTGSRFRP